MRLAMIAAFATTMMIVATNPVWAADQKITLLLGGKFCNLYLGEVESALKKVPGVTAIDFKSRKDHAVVAGDSKMKPDQLVSTINGVKGDGWHCTAEVKK
jgi:hypothetical protein